MPFRKVSILSLSDYNISSDKLNYEYLSEV
jgi:hypothetical protein